MKDERKIPFKLFKFDMDCSRNAVPSLDFLKRWIKLIHELGYNAISFYTEETYELDGEPYFGYGRGRFSHEELKKIDDYAFQKGVQLVPSIQVLAHMNCLKRWPAYKNSFDLDDILLVGDERVYELIEKMIKNCAECFRSRRLKISIDEAWGLGRGKYFDLHGERDKSVIFLEHLNKVVDIAKKYGFFVEYSSDMFFFLACGEYYNPNAQFSDEIRALIPKNTQIRYWDYFGTNPEKYKKMIEAHRRLNSDVGYLGAFHTWGGLMPHNDSTIASMKASLQACIEENVQYVGMSIFGDDSAECAKGAVLPSLFYLSEFVKGNRDEKDIKERFYKRFGIGFDDFMLLDLCHKKHFAHEEKYLLYNDLFTGLFDTRLTGNEGKEYAALARKLARVNTDNEWGYLFKNAYALCRVLAIKADMGQRIRTAYTEDNHEAMTKIIADCKTLSKRLDAFYHTFRDQWYAENKPYGFDVQDIRVGGLMTRVRSCTDRLTDWNNGKINRIDELEETLLDFCGAGEKKVPEPVRDQNQWHKMVTNQVLTYFEIH